MALRERTARCEQRRDKVLGYKGFSVLMSLPVAEIWTIPSQKWTHVCPINIFWAVRFAGIEARKAFAGPHPGTHAEAPG
jgi:hypothetical protein